MLDNEARIEAGVLTFGEQTKTTTYGYVVFNLFSASCTYNSQQ